MKPTSPMDDQCVHIVGARVTFADGRSLRLDYPVAEWVDAGDLLVICLEVPRDVPFDQNVLGLSKSGKILWRIGLRPTPAGPQSTHYIACHKGPAGVAAITWDAMIAYINLADGTIVKQVESK